MKFNTLRMQIEEFHGSNTIRIKEAGTEKQIYVLKKILSLFADVPDGRVQG